MAGSLLGIDVGCSTIKLAELSGGPGSLKLVGLAVGPTPRDAYDAGTILDAQALGKAIAALMSQHRIGARRAAVALSGTEARRNDSRLSSTSSSTPASSRYCPDAQCRQI